MSNLSAPHSNVSCFRLRTVAVWVGLLICHLRVIVSIAAMPKQKTPLAEAGDVWEGLDSYRAHVQFRDGAGFQKHIYGPHRTDTAAAAADLFAMRAVGALFEDDREQGLCAMRAEARRIQERVTFEREIRSAMLRQASSGFDSDSEKAEDDFVDDDPGQHSKGRRGCCAEAEG